MHSENTQTLAEKIARLLEGEASAPDLSSLQSSIENIHERLERLERSHSAQQSAIPNFRLLHPSQEKFAVIEAVADEVFANLQKEKACTFEPNGKPCDHCSMCSSRGF